LIGLFLRGAAGASYQRLMTRQTLEGEPLARFMTRSPVAVDPDLTLDALIENYVYRYYHDLYPVARDGRALGLITIKDIKGVPRARWPYTRVAEVMVSCSPDNTIAVDVDTVTALGVMQRSGNSRLLVVEDERLVGIVALKDLLAFLSLKLDLGSDGER
jgi:CBS domain-containing protein